MGAIDERQVGELVVRIDRELCVGFGDCVEEARQAFQLDEEGVVVFAEPEAVDRDQLVRACDACPVDALSVIDGRGKQLVP